MKKLLSLLLFTIFAFVLMAQVPVTFTTQQDHDNMKQQLRIKKLRSGPSGNESAPNHANYDERIANPCPQLPDILTTEKGKKVTTPDIWWQQRRPELIEAFEKEIYGRMPTNVPKVTWTVKIMDKEFVNRIPVIAKQLVGHVDPKADRKSRRLHVVSRRVRRGHKAASAVKELGAFLGLRK